MNWKDFLIIGLFIALATAILINEKAVKRTKELTEQLSAVKPCAVFRITLNGGDHK